VPAGSAGETPGDPKIRSANGASARSTTVAPAPPAIFSRSVCRKRRRRRPQSCAETYRNPYFVSDSSTVRSRRIWKKPTAASAVAKTPNSASPRTRAATTVERIPKTTAT